MLSRLYLIIYLKNCVDLGRADLDDDVLKEVFFVVFTIDNLLLFIVASGLQQVLHGDRKPA